jgi:acyl carrier protein
VIIKNVTTVEENLRRLVVKVTHNEDVQIAPTATFKGLGVDSLEVVHILVSLEDIYGIDLVDQEMKTIKDMGGFIDYVKKKVAEKMT